MAMTEPDFLRDTRTSYDAIATVYAERFRDELAASRWTGRCWRGLPSWYWLVVPDRSPMSAAVLAG